MPVSLADYPSIVFGPAGLIRGDAEANQELLRRIKETKPLAPENLLKLAAFYVEFPARPRRRRGQRYRRLPTFPTRGANEQLGNHLALIALTKLVNDKEVHELLKSKSSPDAVDSLRDFFEDLWDGGRDESSEPSYIRTPDVWSIPFSGMGLLIETGFQGPEEGYYVIGVCPLSLPDEQ